MSERATDEERAADLAALTVIPPDHWHDCVRLCGNEKGLRRLRDVIDQALSLTIGTGEFIPLSDGEGYHLHVHGMTAAELGLVPQGYAGLARDDEWPDGLSDLLNEREGPFYARRRVELGWDKPAEVGCGEQP